MSVHFVVACDGGRLNTLAGAGGVLDVTVEPSFDARYFEIPDGLGGSLHMVSPTPAGDALVVSSANVGQILIIPKKGDGFDFAAYDVINTFATVAAPTTGTDATTPMFDFLDDDTIVTQYDRKIVRVNIRTKKIDVLADIGAFAPDRAQILHQVSASSRFVVADEVLGGGFFALDRATNEVFFMGDGSTGGHHHVYEDTRGHTIVVRPSFNFQSEVANVKVSSNTLSIYDLDERTVRTFSYAVEQPNHSPVDMFVEDGILYACFAIPGTVQKIDLATGRVLARFSARPSMFTRLVSSLFDALGWMVDFGTFRNGYDRGRFDAFQFANALKLGLSGGTRAGFFALGHEPGSNVLYAAHRGLNRVYCLDKETLALRWKKKLPRRSGRTAMTSALYWAFSYMRGLGVHHGSIVRI